jgi:hypothetical protein
VVTVSSAQLPGQTRARLLVRRLDARGHADPTFRQRRFSTGARSYGGLGVVIDARGRMIIGAAASTTATAGGLLVLRLKSA